MRIVDRKEFLSMPAETVFSKYRPCYFEDISIKGESTPYDDFLYQQIADAIECNGSSQFDEKLSDAEKNGTSLRMDFDCQGRDGMFDEDQLFAVWEKEDVVQLIERLKVTLKEDESWPT